MDQFDSSTRFAERSLGILRAYNGDIERALPSWVGLMLSSTDYQREAGRIYLRQLDYDEFAIDDDGDADVPARSESHSGLGVSDNTADEAVSGGGAPGNSESHHSTGSTPTASVSMFITNAQKAELRAKGYSDAEIAEMKPAQAHQILGLTTESGGEKAQHIVESHIATGTSPAAPQSDDGAHRKSESHPAPGSTVTLQSATEQAQGKYESQHGVGSSAAPPSSGGATVHSGGESQTTRGGTSPLPKLDPSMFQPKPGGSASTGFVSSHSGPGAATRPPLQHGGRAGSGPEAQPQASPIIIQQTPKEKPKYDRSQQNKPAWGFKDIKDRKAHAPPSAFETRKLRGVQALYMNRGDMRRAGNTGRLEWEVSQRVLGHCQADDNVLIKDTMSAATFERYWQEAEAAIKDAA